MVINLITEREVSQPPNKSNNFVCLPCLCFIRRRKQIRYDTIINWNLLDSNHGYVIWNPPLFMFQYQRSTSNKHSLVSSYLVKMCVCVCIDYCVACLVLPSCHFLYFKTIRLICHLPLFYNIIYCISFDISNIHTTFLCVLND